MASFKTSFVGGPCDGEQADCKRAPQDGESVMRRGRNQWAEYRYDWNSQRLRFVGLHSVVDFDEIESHH